MEFSMAEVFHQMMIETKLPRPLRQSQKLSFTIDRDNHFLVVSGQPKQNLWIALELWRTSAAIDERLLSRMTGL